MDSFLPDIGGDCRGCRKGAKKNTYRQTSGDAGLIRGAVSRWLSFSFQRNAEIFFLAGVCVESRKGKGQNACEREDGGQLLDRGIRDLVRKQD